MHFIINSSSMVPIYEQIIEEIKKRIKDGRLKENDPLPSVRKMAQDLRISALTVKKAYDLLEEEGIVKTIHGKGTYIMHIDQKMIAEENKKEIEDELLKVYHKAKNYGLDDKEINEILKMIMEDYI